MNKLYGILLGNADVSAAFSWYYKNYTTVPITNKGVQIRNAFVRDVPEDRMALFASVICYLCLLSPYATEIQKLDNNNTYVQVKRAQSAASSDEEHCMADLIKPAIQYENALDYIDTDIREIVDIESFISIAGAICLQLLREVVA